MLVRLMYASRPVPALAPAELQAILAQSRAANATHGITGLLCCSEQVFIQVLEGGREAVNRLYAHIVADPRHADVTLLVYEEIAERRFCGWTMGQVSLARLNPALLLKYGETAALDPYRISGRASLALFEELIATASIMG